NPSDVLISRPPQCQFSEEAKCLSYILVVAENVQELLDLCPSGIADDVLVETEYLAGVHRGDVLRVARRVLSKCLGSQDASLFVSAPAALCRRQPFDRSPRRPEARNAVCRESEPAIGQQPAGGTCTSKVASVFRLLGVRQERANKL